MTAAIDRAAAFGPGVGEIDDPAGWLDRLDDLFARVLAPAFFRLESRLRAHWYLLGLVSGRERKNGWTLAEFAGDGTPDGMQRLLNAARWDQDAVRDALGRYVAAELGDPGLSDSRTAGTSARGSAPGRWLVTSICRAVAW